MWSILFVKDLDERIPAGILFLDKALDSLYSKLTPDWTLQREEDQIVWEGFQEDLREQSGKAGTGSLFTFLQGSASHFLTVSDAKEIDCEGDIQSVVDALYRTYVKR
jgi:hypothetical protein